ncbi:NAD(P)-dependent dehydrogenase (short-subunit alcohol dehydrogenase family) [Saccharothrix tamanrassetensis]|uniref:NAD(P)-dependent dehydrogenase (Short-subunit alcohol dehydrogenase family) n=1 Tax=Saccharothrix tamanrassetensis TaxID=1051531 RepID=A0A841CS42_9PSEU|nr:SDR family oxidoreductase [Saccharothrix tamanrassetensis]MBB5960581.1 NAD(P)-dependent dehydrogenase (short-subunit alcohol dehydrogenase family) [Saccharothrix tamanrassetensis]
MSLHGKVAAVTGATRGAGRAIAVELGAAGATVFVGGRSTRGHRSPIGRDETIEETAELVTAAGGRGIPVRADFTVAADVDAFRARIESEGDGRLDVLVDDVWGGELDVHFKPFWEDDLERQLGMWRNSVQAHLVTLHRLIPLLIRQPGGLLVEVTDGDSDEVYSGMLAYDSVKVAIRRFGVVLAQDLGKYGTTSVAVTPGFLRSEQMLEHFGVTEENWRDAIEQSPHYAMSETPRYVGRAVAALAADPERERFSGKALASWTLMREYGFTDVDGSRPDWGRWYEEVVKPGLDLSTVDVAKYR